MIPHPPGYVWHPPYVGLLYLVLYLSVFGTVMLVFARKEVAARRKKKEKKENR